MVTREQIVAEARSWLGTPVKHQGQRKGVSADCKGLAVGVARALGMPEGDSIAASARRYSLGFSGVALLEGLRQTLIEVPEPLPGDLLAILLGRETTPRHLAFATEPGWIVHAYGAGVGFVAEVPCSHYRVHSRWTWPSLGGELGG